MSIVRSVKQVINLKCNSDFPDGFLILSKDLYKEFMDDSELNLNLVFINKNLPHKTVVASEDIFKRLVKENKYGT